MLGLGTHPYRRIANDTLVPKKTASDKNFESRNRQSQNNNEENNQPQPQQQIQQPQQPQQPQQQIQQVNQQQVQGLLSNMFQSDLGQGEAFGQLHRMFNGQQRQDALTPIPFSSLSSSDDETKATGLSLRDLVQTPAPQQANLASQHLNQNNRISLPGGLRLTTGAELMSRGLSLTNPLNQSPRTPMGVNSARHSKKELKPSIEKRQEIFGEPPRSSSAGAGGSEATPPILIGENEGGVTRRTG